MRYPEKDAVCPHCEGLTDDQVRRLKIRHNKHLAGSSNLGRLLMYIAGLLLVIMVMYMLRRQ